MVVDLLAQGIDVPELSPETIAVMASELLADYERMVGANNEAPIEVVDIATSLLGLEFAFADLQTEFEDRIHGVLYTRRRLIHIDTELDPDRCPAMTPRFNFTLGHEIGHWVLHRHLFIDDDGHPLVFDDDNAPDIICRSTGRRPLVERQADAFAGCLLMPEPLLRQAWKSFVGGDGPITDSEITKSSPKVDPNRISFIDGDDERATDPKRLLREAFCEPLAAKFIVSQEAMRIQLETLGLFSE